MNQVERKNLKDIAARRPQTNECVHHDAQDLEEESLSESGFPTVPPPIEAVSPVKQVIKQEPVENEPVQLVSLAEAAAALQGNSTPFSTEPEAEVTQPASTSTERELWQPGPRQKLYNCDKCEKSFESKWGFQKHHPVHSGQEKHYPCDKCDESFAQESEQAKQQHTRSVEHLYNCGICSKAFIWKSQWRNHYEMIHYGEWPNTCEKCGKHFKQKWHLRQHRRVHTEDRPYTCELCDKRFKWSGHLTEHKMIHTGERPHACHECGKRFKKKHHLTQHQLTHTSEKPYTCDKCAKSFTLRSYLARHRLVHSGIKPYSCSYCGKSFARKSHMIQHQVLHTGEKPYTCEKCGQRFTQKSHHAHHQRLHTGENLHICDTCGKSFVWKSNLKKHEAVHAKGNLAQHHPVRLIHHAGENPAYNSREKCSEGFLTEHHNKPHTGDQFEPAKPVPESKSLHHLTQHELLHAGGKTYACEKCGKDFTQRIHLRKHQLVHT